MLNANNTHRNHILSGQSEPVQQITAIWLKTNLVKSDLLNRQIACENEYVGTFRFR